MKYDLFLHCCRFCAYNFHFLTFLIYFNYFLCVSRNAWILAATLRPALWKERPSVHTGTAVKTARYPAHECRRIFVLTVLPGWNIEFLTNGFAPQLKPAGTPCRESSNSCDLPEFCTGASPHCPANVYLHDGHSCHNVDGYCYNGICQTHEQQCVTLWGKGV